MVLRNLTITSPWACEELGDELLAVAITRLHPDHVRALGAVVSRFESPGAHPPTGELLGRRLDRALEEGARLDLGEGRANRAGPALYARGE